MSDDRISQTPEEEQDEFVLRLTTGVKMTLPVELSQWLGRTLLLYGVPFNYLVPDERMLPPESIRFFYLDPGWMKCLLEGACSVGRTTTREQAVDQHLSRRFLEQAPTAAAAVRSRAPTGTELAWPLTGFLLRSQVVEGWQGLEMTASGQRENGDPYPLRPLRIDRLGPDVMLAIFNGKVTKIVIKQPPEGMHFGAAPSRAPNAYEKITLRRVNAEGNAEPGDQIDGAPLRLPMRTGVERVVDVQTLQEKLQERLNIRDFTSAEFALQMVDSPGMVIFTPENGATE